MATRAELEAARGRPVRCADGETLGRVSETRDETFLCDRGGFFPTTWVIRLADVASVATDAVVLVRPAIDYRGPSLRSGRVLKPLATREKP